MAGLSSRTVVTKAKISTQFCSKLLSCKLASDRGHVKTNKEMGLIPIPWGGWTCFIDLGALCMDYFKEHCLRTSVLKHTYFWVSLLDAVCRDVSARDFGTKSLLPFEKCLSIWPFHLYWMNSSSLWKVELIQLGILEPEVFLGGQEIDKLLLDLEWMFGRQMFKGNLGTREKPLGCHTFTKRESLNWWWVWKNNHMC